jgi:hypothetical protein
MKTIVVTHETPDRRRASRQLRRDVLVVRAARAVALLIPFDDDDVEWYVRERDPKFIASIAEAQKQVVEGKTISHDELLGRLGMK